MLGVERHLGYLDSPRVTAIWLCPVLENDMPDGSYHGYATTDYYRIDPRFGTNDDWRRLVGKAHDRNMKVVMDMIFNHSDPPIPGWPICRPRTGITIEGDVLTNFVFPPSTIRVSDYDLDHGQRMVRPCHARSQPEESHLMPI